MRRLVPVLMLLAVIAACGTDTDKADTKSDADPSSTSSASSASSAVDPTSTSAVGSTSTSAPAAVVDPYTSKVYAQAKHWICRGKVGGDLCAYDLNATSVAADGSLTADPFVAPAEAPKVDCFYLYPTASEDATPLSDLTPGAEVGPVQKHLLRFTSLCRPFAPVYRSVTVSGLFGGGGTADTFEKSFASVEDAWKQYLANDNDGRGVILIGHSQGSGHLNRLMSEVIEPDENQRKLLVSAYLLGSGVRVPEGTLVGGDFSDIAGCSKPDEFGCIVSYASFRSTATPPANSFFGKPRDPSTNTTAPDSEVLCIDPTELLGRQYATPYFAGGKGLASEPANAQITTDWVTLPDFLQVECVRRDGFHYLEVTVGGDPSDPRIDDIGGDLTPEWGLHGVDVLLDQGDLVELARRQTAAYLAAS